MNKNSSFKNIPVASVAPDFAKNFPMILKVLHIMFGNNPSLEVTAHKFLEKTRTTTQLEDIKTFESIQEIKTL